jgi:hypothetical protein
VVVGVIVDPAGPVSVTVAVHSVDWLTMRVESTHERTVVVGRSVAMRLVEPLLDAWVVSPG